MTATVADFFSLLFIYLLLFFKTLIPYGAHPYNAQFYRLYNYLLIHFSRLKKANPRKNPSDTQDAVIRTTLYDLTKRKIRIFKINVTSQHHLIKNYAFFF